MNRWVGGVAVVVAVVMILAGCSGKKKSGGLDEGAGAGGLGEEPLSGTPGGSLDLARAGRLGAEGDTGPLRDIHFDYDSFELDDTSRQTLQENAEWLKDHPEVRVEIEGHCDDRGTVEYNLALGAKRAAAAKGYFVALGIERDRLTTISYGEELPLCHDETESCWASNRRAHFVPVGN
jgi:peptidoglycan-associated lipoprotein